MVKTPDVSGGETDRAYKDIPFNYFRDNLVVWRFNMKSFSTKTKVRLLLALAVLVLLMLVLGSSGCTATHAQVTFGTGDEGVAAATAMAAGDPHPAMSGASISNSSNRTITRPARD